MLLDNTDMILAQLDNAFRNAQSEIGTVGTAEIQSNAPVLTGNLRRSYTFESEQSGTTYIVIFGTNVDYAVYVEMKPESRGGRPHLRRALESELQEFNKIVRKHLSRVGR